MAKKILITILLLSVMLSSVYFITHTTNGVRPGMTFDELYERGDFVLYKDGHFFYKNWAGNYVIARLHSSFDPKANQVEEVRVFSTQWIFPTHGSFARLQEGMTFFEVAALVGIPFRETTSGVSTADYKAADGSIYMTGWRYDGTNATLTSVRLMEDNRPAAYIVYLICGVAAILLTAVLLILKKKGVLFKKQTAESQ